MPRSKVSERALRKARALNMTIGELADYLNVAHASVARAEKRHNINLLRSREMTPIHHRVCDISWVREETAHMPDDEAFDYVVSILEMLLLKRKGGAEDFMKYGLSLAPARLFQYLLEHSPRTCTHDMIMQNLYITKNPDNWPRENTLKVYISKIRRVIEANNLPYQIDVHWGVGWSLQPVSVKESSNET